MPSKFADLTTYSVTQNQLIKFQSCFLKIVTVSVVRPHPERMGFYSTGCSTSSESETGVVVSLIQPEDTHPGVQRWQRGEKPPMTTLNKLLRLFLLLIPTTLSSARSEVFVPRGGNFLPKGIMIPWMWRTRPPSGHLGLLMPLSQQAMKELYLRSALITFFGRNRVASPQWEKDCSQNTGHLWHIS